ncbi:hypothetical protein HU200_053174 [Digitaria exilis]|uniref:DNA (cytosine-5-)-methyltransferase n=1 Tax=Digitaria exilis TaxID=1010633 RepID=A0A835AHL5_9POAL|nr:hypothetical protein HU200_053174 [Digitaria exilis]
MEPPPPDPTSPAPDAGPVAGSSSPGGGAAEGDDAAGEFGAELDLEPLWSLLFGDPAELEPMWEFGAGFAAPEAEPEDGHAEGPWDGAPWRSTGVVAGEGAANTSLLGVPSPVAAAGFLELDPAAAAAPPGDALEATRPLDSAPHSSSPLPPCPQAPVDLEARAPELIPSCEPAAALQPAAVASSEAELEERILECTLNSVPSPPPPQDPDLGAEHGTNNNNDMSSDKLTSQTMVVIALSAVKRPMVVNAASCSTPDVVAGDATSLRRSSRIVSIKAKANATPSESKADSYRASKLHLAVPEQSSISEGNQHPVSSSSTFEEAMVAPTKPVELLDGVKPQGPQDSVAAQSSTDVVVALPVVNKRSLKNKAVSMSSPRKTKSASKALANSNRVSAVSVPVINCGPAVHKAVSCIPPRRHKLPSEKCLPSFGGVDAVVHNSGLVSANEVVHDMPQELQSASSQPPKAKRARVSSRKCSVNLKGAENNSSSISELPMADPKLVFGKNSTDPEMVDSKDSSCFFMGEAVPDEEARQRWPNRYSSNHCLLKKGLNCRFSYEMDILRFANITASYGLHYAELVRVDMIHVTYFTCGFFVSRMRGAIPKCFPVLAMLSWMSNVTICKLVHVDLLYVLGIVHLLSMVNFVQGPEGKPHYIGRLLEFFETIAGERYFSVQWFFRAEDTVMEDQAQSHDPRRLFYSDLKDDKRLDCIVSEVTILQTSPSVSGKSRSIPSFHYYYDMKYSLDYTTFSTIEMGDTNGTLRSQYTSSNNNVKRIDVTEKQKSPASEMRELSLLDLYCGRGGMSTGLCLGAHGGGVNLIAVRNETTDDFLELLKEWEKLCKTYPKPRNKVKSRSNVSTQSSNETTDCSTIPPEEFEVWKLVDICFGDPNGVRNRGLYFKGDVDVICGGPPCQGISGYNRNRDFDAPFNCERNKQIIVFMDLMQFLKPKYIYMENVLDILKFADAKLARYTISRLVAMHYQAKLGIMAAGCYGLPQFRMRRNLVGWPEGMPMQLEKPIVLEDALSDLPVVKKPLQSHQSCFQGANFRDLPGVIVGPDNVARLDPTKERILLPSGNPLVIDCILTYEHGKSLRPYGRLWWDEVVGTILTCPNARVQALIHPAQDRLLTVRESARLQGFPDCFRYRQIGNAVAVPVGRALGYALAMAILNKTGDDHLMVLPPKFAFSHDIQSLPCPNSLQSGNI